MARYVVARAADIPPGGNKVITINGREIVVFHLNGEFFALLNRCPHGGAPLDKAVCVAHLSSDEPGEYRRTRVGEILRCGWHGWEFDVRTGRSYCDPQRTRVPCFPVRVERCESVAGPSYMAETFVVEVANEHVIVEA
jgi:nitrite reductase/ring-hydroxylating ferredoxin subunit